MLENTLSLIHNGITFLFGVYISAAFLGVRMNRKNIFTLFGFSSVTGIFYITSFVLLGTVVTTQIYPLIIHIPLILFLIFFYKFRTAPTILSVLIAYLCCQISNWIGILILELFKKEWLYYSVRIAITIIVFILLMRYVALAASQLLQKPTKAIIILGIMPFVYYLFDYITKVYTELLYSGQKVVVEFLGFVLCITYIIFFFLYFRQYEEKRNTEQYNMLIRMKMESSAKELDAIKHSEYAISIIRHDIRHFLGNISCFIESGENDKALSYIREIIAASDKTAIQKYSKNEIVNMIVSSYENEIKKYNIDFKYHIQVPEHLSISDVDLTSILSNGLREFHSSSFTS